MRFASWAYDGTKIDLVLSSTEGDQSNYMTSTEWHLHLIRAEKGYIIYSWYEVKMNNKIRKKFQLRLVESLH